MSAFFPDVNVLLAFAWDSHAEHLRVRSWLMGVSQFSTSPITELGFMRMSMSPAYAATFQDAISVLEALHQLKSASKIHDDFDAVQIPEVTRYKDTTDAYLVKLAEAHGLRFATLDQGILNADWSSKIAINPLTSGST
ncbi:MAG: PIN domain-containing protein [Verrucomicrobiota bacterium]